MIFLLKMWWSPFFKIFQVGLTMTILVPSDELRQLSSYLLPQACCGGGVNGFVIPIVQEFSPSPLKVHHHHPQIIDERELLGSRGRVGHFDSVDPINPKNFVNPILLPPPHGNEEENLDEENELPVGKRQTEPGSTLGNKQLEGEERRPNNFLDGISNRLAKHNERINKTLENVNIGINFGTAGLQAFIEDSNQRKLKGINAGIGRIGNFFRTTFAAISGIFSAVTRGFQQFIQAIFGGGNNASVNSVKSDQDISQGMKTSTASPFHYQV